MRDKEEKQNLIKICEDVHQEHNQIVFKNDISVYVNRIINCTDKSIAYQ